MTHTIPGAAPDVLCEPSACNEALMRRWMDPDFPFYITPEFAFFDIDDGGVDPPSTGIFYTVSERVYASNGAVQEWRYDDWRLRRATATANVAARKARVA